MTATLAAPAFEGSEKRLEVHFEPRAGAAPSATGLRALPRATLDALMSLAACEIISKASNAHLDAYVLSESSLFVYPATWVLKTCGTTRLLSCLPELLREAEGLGLRPAAAKYSRASFLFPDDQPQLYQCFDREAAVLRTHFPTFHSAAHVLGDAAHGLQWHVFAAAERGAAPPPSPCASAYEADSAALSADSCSDVEDAVCDVAPRPPTKAPPGTLEVCMTELDPAAAAQFFRSDAFVSSAATTSVSGIRALVSDALVDDYVFEPCGYSMNGILGGAFMTIHVTPEPGFSYASCEFHSFPDDVVDPAAIVAAVVAIFRPARFVVAHSGAGAVAPRYTLPGYEASGHASQDVHERCRVHFSSLSLGGKVPRCGSGLSESTCGAPGRLVSAHGSMASLTEHAAEEGNVA